MACKPGSASANGPAAITCSPREIARGSSTRWSRERLAIQLNFSRVLVQTCGPLLLNRILATASFSLTRLHDASTWQNKGRVHWSGVANLARPKCAISQKSRILVRFHRFSYRTHQRSEAAVLPGLSITGCSKPFAVRVSSFQAALIFCRPE